MASYPKTKVKSFQEWLEVNIWGLLIATALVLSVGGLVEIVPLFIMKNTFEHNQFPEIVWEKAGREPIVTVDESGKEQWNWKPGDGVRPYTALELAGRDVYQYGDLAALVGVNKTNWSQNYVEHYDVMVSLYKGLDSQSLHHVSRSRSQQKAANYQQGIAEMN